MQRPAPVVLSLPSWCLTCGAGGLRSAHSEAVAFQRDGLHKEGHYTLGQSPLALIWKDASCCRFLLDTDLNGQPLQHQVPCSLCCPLSFYRVKVYARLRLLWQ
jgi:hypothetical protein